MQRLQGKFFNLEFGKLLEGYIKSKFENQKKAAKFISQKLPIAYNSCYLDLCGYCRGNLLGTTFLTERNYNNLEAHLLKLTHHLHALEIQEDSFIIRFLIREVEESCSSIGIDSLNIIYLPKEKYPFIPRSVKRVHSH